jgi:hypothetical protein
MMVLLNLQNHRDSSLALLAQNDIKKSRGEVTPLLHYFGYFLLSPSHQREALLLFVLLNPPNLIGAIDVKRPLNMVYLVLEYAC